MDFLKKYYTGIYNQIQSEVEYINSLFQHQGIKGEGNENIIRDLLKKFIPNKYGIGTGILIDRKGNVSKQCDIIIYDNYNYPEIFTLSSVHIFPVDLVYAVIEVKTTLTNTNSKLAVENIKSVKKLDFIKHFFRVIPEEEFKLNDPDAHIFLNKTTQPPLGLVFAYQSDTNNFETIEKWFAFKNSVEQAQMPSHIFCLDHGYILTQYGKATSIYLCPLVKEDTFYTCEDLQIIKKNKKDWAIKNNELFPVSKLKNENILIDQAKVLLNFIMMLPELLHNKIISNRLTLREDYFTDELKSFLTINNNKISYYKE